MALRSLRSKQLPSQQPFQKRQATLDSVTSRTNSPSITGLNSTSARFPCQYTSELFIFKQILCRPHGIRENNQLNGCNELGRPRRNDDRAGWAALLNGAILYDSHILLGGSPLPQSLSWIKQHMLWRQHTCCTHEQTRRAQAQIRQLPRDLQYIRRSVYR